MDNEKYADIDIFYRETKYIDNQQRDTGRVLRLMFNVNVHKGVWGGAAGLCSLEGRMVWKFPGSTCSCLLPDSGV